MKKIIPKLIILILVIVYLFAFFSMPLSIFITRFFLNILCLILILPLIYIVYYLSNSKLITYFLLFSLLIGILGIIFSPINKLSDIYDEKNIKVNVVDIKNNKIIIYNKNLNNGDYIEINKPLISNIKKGNKIIIKYNEYEPNSYYYPIIIIPENISSTMYSFGISGTLILSILIICICILKNKKNEFIKNCVKK